MNGRLRTSVDEQTAAHVSPTIPSAQTLRAQITALASSNRLQPPSSRQSPAGLDYASSSPSDYPSPYPGGFDQDSSRPESSAQGASRYIAFGPSTQSRSRPSEQAFSDLSSPLSSEPPTRPIDHTNDTFGRTSGKSALSDVSAARRKTSPTERSAFGYLQSSCAQPSSSDQSNEITEYLNQGSVHGHRQQKIDALEKELNLSGSSSPFTGTGSSNDDDMWTTGATASSQLSVPVVRQRSHPNSLAISGSDTPDRTFGRPSNDRSHPTTHSDDSRPGQDGSRPSQSETTSSRDTDRSHDAAYGVGEAGGDQQFASLTRTLTPGQRRQQEELGRMSQQRSLAATPGSPSTTFTSQLTSPMSTQAAQRASHQSNATIMATTASLASSSTPKHDARLSRQTQGTTSSGAARPLSSTEEHDYQIEFGHKSLFAGEAVGSGSQDSIDVLNEQASPQLAEGLAPARSASVRVKTPIFGNTLTELPPDQRASVVGALHERAAPYPSQGSTQGGIVNLNSEPEREHNWYALYDPQHAQAQAQAAQQSYTNGPQQEHAYAQGPQPVDQQYQATRGYYMQPPQPQGNVGQTDQGYSYPAHATGNINDGTRTPHLPNLGDMYAVAPKFPPAPYAKYRDLRLSSRVARIHHTILPLLTYAHIPATLFLDYNVIFALVQIALHPDSTQTGWRTAWWIALGIYGGCVLVWLIGVVVIYEGLWSFRRRWTVPQPLVMPIYLSSPAFVRTAIKDYSLYSLLYRARKSGNRRDALIETFWHYSQNWPTVLTLLPRGVISAILLVFYKPSGPTLITQGVRDPVYFNRATQRFSQFAFILITIQASWAAWKLGVLLLANLGLAATLGCKSLIQQEQDRNAVADTELTSFAGHSRRGLVARQFGSQPTGAHSFMQEGDNIQQATHRRWAWRWRAEDRIRAILFDAGLLHEPIPMQDWHHEPKETGAPVEEHAGDRTFDSTQVVPTTYAQAQGAGGYGQLDQPRDWFGTDLRFSQSQTGLALTSPEAVQPEMWAAAQGEHTEAAAATVTPAPQAFHVQHLESSPSDEGDNSDASDPYSPAPLPIGRSPRSKEQLRDASSISSRNDRTSMRASSISSLNRLAALNAAPSGSRDSALLADGGATPISAQQSRDDMYTASKRAGGVFDGEPDGHGLRSHEQQGSILRTQPGGLGGTAEVPEPASALPAQSSNDTALLTEWRGRKRPRSSPVLAYFPALNPGGMVTETEDWLRGQIDEEDDEETGQDDRRDAEAASKKPEMFDNDRSIMHAFVPPMPASFAMSKDPSLAGSPDQGGSDTKHGSWTAAAPNPELFTPKPAASASTPPMRQPADAPNASSTSLSSSTKGRRSGTYSRPRSSGHGHEASSEDGVSLEGVEGGKKRGRNSLLGRVANYSSSESSRRSGSGGRVEGESWIASLFGAGRSASRKVSPTVQSSSPKVGGSSADMPAMRPSGSTPRSETEPQMDNVPVVITTSASTTLPTADSGSVQQHEVEQGGSQSMAPGSLLLAPIGAAGAEGRRSASPAGSYDSNASGGTDDSEEGRLWASFPDQSRRHPPGLIALDIEQRTLAERRLAAAANESNAAMQQHRLLYGPSSGTAAPSVPGSALHLSPLMHPNVLAAISNGSPLGLPGMLSGVTQLSVSPSEGGLHAIREESWSSSLDSRSQGAATGSTRSRGTASALTASPVDADFPLEQIEEVAVPHHSSAGSGASRALRRRDSS
ncbi:uncharacterized protein UTRI_00819_B [Ustilago trichophora]|uniref:Proteophosphoglycan ppg4 n=1 Tax=Ustilago trichophora TaxID=86804 RepID=A0A5C3DQM0_9BASI|nr:uncharacterized protein UTRI_00819_B [Ustilago trichophora]